MSKQRISGGHTSTGHRLSNADFIDGHYAACRDMYEAMLRAVGIQQGWNILDAGCGSGSFLPLMAELVGPRGRIQAYDLAPENIERVEASIKDWEAQVTTNIGNLTALPFEDNTFDAVWNANVTQYLSDEELSSMLREFARVVKPGGLVAIKEHDATTLQFYPFDTFVHWRWLEKNPNMYPWVIRSFSLPTWLEATGLVEVGFETFLQEIHAPLPKHVHEFMLGVLQFFASEAEKLDLSEDDMKHWRSCLDADDPENPVNHPKFYFREGCNLFLGRKPQAK